MGHIKGVHEKMKNHICETCGSAFDRRDSLRKHISFVHEKARPHKCSHCAQTFTKIEYLRKHVNSTHEGVKQSNSNDSRTLSAPDPTKFILGASIITDQQHHLSQGT